MTLQSRGEEADGGVLSTAEIDCPAISFVQVLLESRAQANLAYQYIADLRESWPECLKGVKTAQLAQELLMYKENYIQEIAQTGCLTCASPI